jgi:branched-chain amino acid transport system permease protein
VSIGLSVSFGAARRAARRAPGADDLRLVLHLHRRRLGGSTRSSPGVVLMPAFFVLGVLIYRFYYETFERRGSRGGVRGLAFFFGLAFIIEVGLILGFGVDQRTVQAPYIGSSWVIGDYRLPYRMLVAFGIATGFGLSP